MLRRPIDPEVVVILPALDERHGIGLTIEEALTSLQGPRIIVVDDHSNDGTPEIAAKYGATILTQNGHGKGAAIRQGINHLNELSPRPSRLILCDADHSYSLSSSPTMVDLITRDPSVGMVVGNRFSNFKPWDYLRDRYTFGNLILRGAHRLLNGVRLKDPLSGLRVLRLEAIEGGKMDSTGFDLEVELNCRLHKAGWKICEVPVTYRRRAGRKKLRVADGFGILRRMLKHSFGQRA